MTYQPIVSLSEALKRFYDPTYKEEPVARKKKGEQGLLPGVTVELFKHPGLTRAVTKLRSLQIERKDNKEALDVQTDHVIGLMKELKLPEYRTGEICVTLQPGTDKIKVKAIGPDPDRAEAEGGV